jgi:hypothetical protein
MDNQGEFMEGELISSTLLNSGVNNVEDPITHFNSWSLLLV